MVSRRMEPGGLWVELTRGEKVAAVRRADIFIAWRQIRSAEAVADPIRLVHGLRAPGLGLVRTKIGTWRSKGHKVFAVTNRNSPGLRIMLQDNAYDEILVSIPSPGTLAGQIASRSTAAEPADPPHHRERLVAFSSGGVTLAATVLLPAAGHRVRAAAVLITGSGPLDRDGNHRRAPLEISRAIAEHLAASGVATLRYDKRGVGASGGSYLRAGLQDNIDDARAAIESLSAQPECRGVPVFAIGHSEGGVIVQVLAGESGTKVGGAVLVASQAQTGEQTLIWQSAQIAPTLPKPVKLILRVMRTEPAKQQRKALNRIEASTTDTIRIQGRRINAKWFREFLAFDPIPHLAAITVPALAITGDKDLQVDPADLDIIAATAAGPVTVRRVADLTHILRRDPNPATLGAYRTLIRQPVDSAVLKDISGWISEVVAATDQARAATDG